jgi:hypothetical protein
MLRRLRLGNLRKLFRDRYGPIFPDDDAGRADLQELLLPISLGPHADIKMPNAIEVWAPWMKPDRRHQPHAGSATQTNRPQARRTAAVDQRRTGAA